MAGHRIAPRGWVVWAFAAAPHGFVLDQLLGVDDVVDLVEGVPFGGEHPELEFTVNPFFPNACRLYDTFDNRYNLTVASPRVVDFLKARRIQQVEFLPVLITNQKGRPAAGYFIVHPAPPVDGLDVEKSQVLWSELDDTVIDEVQQIALKNNIAPDQEVIKLRYFYDHLLVRRELADAMQRESFTGIRWIPADQFSSEDA